MKSLRSFALALTLGLIPFDSGRTAESGETQPARKANRLLQEKSPYLLQHAYNPVDWYPWGQEAFDAARKDDRLIFLSIGYSTCHWCHVMERESFESEAIAEIMNRHFVCIKVDREERPDVDKIYMTFVQASTGSGGWPLNVWLTPDLKPIAGATYFPPEDKFGRPGFPTVLQSIADLWENNRKMLRERGDEVMNLLRRHFNTPPPLASSDADQTAEAAFRSLNDSFDPTYGGFGEAPKFPRPVTLNFLQRYAVRTTGNEDQREHAQKMALATLERMAAGGLRDHLGGGFHRYSVDRFWHVPHFEKMLYDQAQITIAALEAFQVTGQDKFAAIARDTLRYVLRGLTHPQGGFYSAEDADSLFERGKPEQGEGAFYVWSHQEIVALLGQERAERFNLFYGVEPSGNAPVGSDPHEEFNGKNILIQRYSLEDAAEKLDTTPAALAQELAADRTRLFRQRESRPRPHLDDKVITAWNGLMISAFARASQVLDEPDYLKAARAAAAFVKRNLYLEEEQELLRTYRQGASDIRGFSDDYAFLVQGLLDLYEASFDIKWLRWAQQLQRTQDRLFWDEQSAGYFSTTGKDPSILLRLKEDYDGAVPSPNSVTVLNLLRLAQMTGQESLGERVRKTLAYFTPAMNNSPGSMPQMLAALLFSTAKTRQVVFAAQPQAEDLRPFLRTLHRSFLPDKIVLLADGAAGQAFLGQSLPFLREVRPKEDRATAFLCENFVCQVPTNDPELFAKQLFGAAASDEPGLPENAPEPAPIIEKEPAGEGPDAAGSN